MVFGFKKTLKHTDNNLMTNGLYSHAQLRIIRIKVSINIKKKENQCSPASSLRKRIRLSILQSMDAYEWGMVV